MSLRCLDLCLDQPLLGSASQSRWLVMVDQPRPWKAKIQHSLNLSAECQRWLDDFRARGESFTLLARHRAGGEEALFAWKQGRALRLQNPEDEAGEPIPPVFLVCTHGSRDSCCGSLGPRLAELLAPLGEVWEVSHMGGHRFAPTMWQLPSWRVYGRLPLEAARTADLGPDFWQEARYLRGNAAYPARLQVLEAYLRESRQHWPVYLEERPDGYRVDWPDGTQELWQADFSQHTYRGPLSCRDIPQDIEEDYTAFRVEEAQCLGPLAGVRFPTGKTAGHEQ